VLFNTGDRFEFEITPEGDRPTDTFSLTDNADVPAGQYEWTRYLAGITSASKRPVNAHFNVQWGPYYDGDLTTIEASLGVRPISLLTLDASFERNTGEVNGVHEVAGVDLPIKARIQEELYGLRVALNFSSDLQFTSFTQYDNQSRELGSNNRLRWTFAPQGDLFLVYNHSLERGLDKRWRFHSNELPVKLQYAWRF
jgi:hypothetical protein